MSPLSTICPQPWNADPTAANGLNKSAVCPYGKKLPGDVTLPNDATFVDWICVVYGYIPFVLIGLVALSSICRGVMRAVKRHAPFELKTWVFLGYVIFITFLNEVIFKQLVSQARPVLSCNTSCGMPSGHSTMAIGFFALAVFDAAYRVNSIEPQLLEDAVWFREMESKNQIVDYPCFDIISSFPLAPKPTLSPKEFLAFFILWFVLLVPVPFTRTVLNDHTAAQVMVGSSIGSVEAMIWFALARRFLQQNANLGKAFCGCCEHNYALPVVEVETRAAKLIADGEEADEKEVQGVQQMLQWYVDQIDDLDSDSDEEPLSKNQGHNVMIKQRLMKLKGRLAKMPTLGSSRV